MVRYLSPPDHNLRRIAKSYKDFGKRLDLKAIKFQSKLETYIKSKKIILSSLVVFGYENKEKHPIYVSKKCCEQKHVNLLLIEGKKLCFHQRFQYIHVWSFPLHCGRKHFCHYCLHAFTTEEIKIASKFMVKKEL